eukprot:m.5629 g.5629  ORF g.5629 m.5629 type:complete len:111 (+) comp7824_c0_seq1:75-407(+)
MSLYSHFKTEQPGARKSKQVVQPTRSSRPSSSKATSVQVIPTDQNAAKEVELLKQFDMDSKFGPCVGVSRLERWERAQAFGLSPPLHVKELLDSHVDDQLFQQCLWHDTL